MTRQFTIASWTLLVSGFIASCASLITNLPVHADAFDEHPFAISSSWPVGVQNYIRVEESLTVFNVIWHYANVLPGANDCYLFNCEAPAGNWAVEWQRYGHIDVIAGVLHGDPAQVSTGLKMFAFGFHREAANGHFVASQGPFHGTAMFLAEVAPALIFLRYSPMGKQFATQIAWQTEESRRAARYMYGQREDGERIDGSQTDRFSEAALALYATGMLSGNPQLKSWSYQYGRGWVRRERADGILPVRGGHDASYQALGMEDASRYILLLASGTLRDSMFAALRRAEQWEASRIRPDGSLDTQGDTRTASHPFPASVFSAFSRWSVMTAEPDVGATIPYTPQPNSIFANLAYLVWHVNLCAQSQDKAQCTAGGLQLSSTQIARGQTLTVWGTGYGAYEGVDVKVGTMHCGQATTNQTGLFGGHSAVPPVRCLIPLGMASGTYVVKGGGGWLKRPGGLAYREVRKTTLNITG